MESLFALALFLCAEAVQQEASSSQGDAVIPETAFNVIRVGAGTLPGSISGSIGRTHASSSPSSRKDPNKANWQLSSTVNYPYVRLGNPHDKASCLTLCKLTQQAHPGKSTCAYTCNGCYLGISAAQKAYSENAKCFMYSTELAGISSVSRWNIHIGMQLSCADNEKPRQVGVFNSAAECQKKGMKIPSANYVIWRGDSNHACWVCSLQSDNPVFTSLPGACSFHLGVDNSPTTWHIIPNKGVPCQQSEYPKFVGNYKTADGCMLHASAQKNINYIIWKPEVGNQCLVCSLKPGLAHYEVMMGVVSFRLGHRPKSLILADDAAHAAEYAALQAKENLQKAELVLPQETTTADDDMSPEVKALVNQALAMSSPPPPAPISIDDMALTPLQQAQKMHRQAQAAKATAATAEIAAKARMKIAKQRLRAAVKEAKAKKAAAPPPPKSLADIVSEARHKAGQK